VVLAFAVWGQRVASHESGGNGPTYHYFYVTDPRKSHIANNHTGFLVLRNAQLTVNIRTLSGVSHHGWGRGPWLPVPYSRKNDTGLLGFQFSLPPARQVHYWS